MTKIKICGITNLDDGLMCAEAGADMLGLNFYEPSPRYIEPDSARELVGHLRNELGDDCPILVGVFVNTPPKKIRAIHAHVRLDYDQLSGDEGIEDLEELKGKGFKAIRPTSFYTAVGLVEKFQPYFVDKDNVPAILLDAFHPTLYGGTGETTSEELGILVQRLTSRMMLAGGLKPENVHDRVSAIQPWGVDTASGVEYAPGLKSIDKVQAFIQAVRSVG